MHRATDPGGPSLIRSAIFDVQTRGERHGIPIIVGTMRFPDEDVDTDAEIDVVEAAWEATYAANPHFLWCIDISHPSCLKAIPHIARIVELFRKFRPRSLKQVDGVAVIAPRLVRTLLQMVLLVYTPVTPVQVGDSFEEIWPNMCARLDERLRERRAKFSNGGNK